MQQFVGLNPAQNTGPQQIGKSAHGAIATGHQSQYFQGSAGHLDSGAA